MANWKTLPLWGVALVAGFLATGSVFASNWNDKGGNGSEIPTPFSAMNQHVELADGEEYVLVGTVEVKPTYSSFGQGYRAFFHVDLEQSPWLANAKREEHPYYPLRGTAEFWRSYVGKRVKIPVVAHGVVNSSSRGADEYEIELSYGSSVQDIPIETCLRDTGRCN